MESEFCPQCGNQLFTKQENKCSCGWKNFTIKRKDEKLLEVEQKLKEVN